MGAGLHAEVSPLGLPHDLSVWFLSPALRARACIRSNRKIPPELLRFDGIFMFVLYVKRSAKGGSRTPMKYMENGHARWSFMNLLERLCIAPSFVKDRKHSRPFF